jgi:hypothetical protein
MKSIIANTTHNMAGDEFLVEGNPFGLREPKISKNQIQKYKDSLRESKASETNHSHLN